MAEQRGDRGGRGRRRVREEQAPPAVLPSLEGLRGTHRAANPDAARPLRPYAQPLSFGAWRPMNPMFLILLHGAGLGHLPALFSIVFDHRLITAMVERWSPDTNSFHLPVGEMTITLEDVAYILGLRIDGPPMIAHPTVGPGLRWRSYPDMCDELLGEHPLEDVLYEDPENPENTAHFTMGQAAQRTCVPLRWLRWRFSARLQENIPEIELIQCVRAYILYIIGLFLLPDTSGCEVHLMWLTLIENLEIFAQYSIGSAVLSSLYYYLRQATHPERKVIGGCVTLLQIWCWEHLHLGRPICQNVPNHEIVGQTLAHLWVGPHVTNQHGPSVEFYRNELDALLDSQVIWAPYSHIRTHMLAPICRAGSDIYLCRVPIIAWIRVEWYMPERVMRQFGYLPHTGAAPIDPTFSHPEARGRAGMDWYQAHAIYIEMWANRRNYVHQPVMLNARTAVASYMRWYRSWAVLHRLVAPPIAPPTGYVPGAPLARSFVELGDVMARELGGLTMGTSSSVWIEHRDQLFDYYRGQAGAHYLNIDPFAEYQEAPQAPEDIPGTSEVRAGDDDDDDFEDDVIRRIRRAPSRYTPGSGAVRRRARR